MDAESLKSFPLTEILAGKYQNFKKLRRHQGLLLTLFYFGYTRMQKLWDMRIGRCLSVRMDQLNPKFFHPPAGLKHGWIDEKTLRQFSSQNPQIASREFVDEFIAKGDRCYGFMDGEELVAFSMFSNKETFLTPELKFGFNPEYVYMYNGHTHPQHRGKNYHGFSMAMGLKHYAEKGHKGLVSFVEIYNQASLKSCYRMGYKNFGTFASIKILGRHWIKMSSGCTEFGVKVHECHR